eukprot:scaffold1384_cov222-Chaetoceros_neogracile.AAC.1
MRGSIQKLLHGGKSQDEHDFFRARSIYAYCHRLGETAPGAEGFATSFITNDDEGIMAPLKTYLESVIAAVHLL